MICQGGFLYIHNKETIISAGTPLPLFVIANYSLTMLKIYSLYPCSSAAQPANSERIGRSDFVASVISYRGAIEKLRKALEEDKWL